MAELQQMGTLDPAARESLMADLKQTDPALWPLMMQQFRAYAAYRHQAEQHDKAAAEQNRPTAVAAAPQSIAGPSVPPASVASPVAVPRRGLASRRGGTGCPIRSEHCSIRPTVASAVTVAVAVAVAIAGAVPSPTDGAPGKPPFRGPQAGPNGQVIQASYNAAAPIDWQAHLAAAIHQLEAESKGAAKSDTAVAQQAYLRMLYLLAGRRNDALSPIPGASPAAQDYWSKQLYGLATWLDTDHTPDGARRAAETKRILSEAMMRLGEAAPLVVHNMAFCSSVQSFGSTTPFRKAEFAPGQEVLLYAEVENYTVEPTQRGFHTALRSSYQIFDARGQRIADHEFPATEEYCQSPRHDFFIGYKFFLPKRIYNGKHTLQLTIEDLKSHKVGQSSIDLSIKDPTGKGGEE